MRRLRLRRFGLSPSAVTIRVGTVALLAVVAIAIASGRTDEAGVGLLCAAAVCAGIVAAYIPDGPWATVCVGLLASSYAVSPPSRGTFGEIAGAVSLAAALWVIHSGYALAAVVPLRARADTSLLARWVGRICLILMLSLPVATAAAWLGRHAPAAMWIRVLGVAVLLVVAASPLTVAVRSVRGEPR
jgi:hypothetical protein